MLQDYLPTGKHILQVSKSHRRVCLIGGHVLHKGMSHKWTCFTGVHEL